MHVAPLSYKIGACQNFVKNFSDKNKKIFGFGLVQPGPSFATLRLQQSLFKGAGSILLMEARMCQIKWENCFASLLMVIHTKYNGRRCGRQDLIVKTKYFLGRRKENTLFKRWK